MDYIVRKHKKIAYCILDNIDNQFSTSSQEVARNLSDFLLTSLIRKDYDIFIDSDTDRLLRRVSQDTYYSHAVVLITGTHMGLSERLFDAVESKCQEHFTIAGHILDRSKFDGYYEILKVGTIKYVGDAFRDYKTGNINESKIEILYDFKKEEE
jgi:hypothetical protein